MDAYGQLTAGMNEVQVLLRNIREAAFVQEDLDPGMWGSEFNRLVSTGLRINERMATQVLDAAFALTPGYYGPYRYYGLSISRRGMGLIGEVAKDLGDRYVPEETIWEIRRNIRVIRNPRGRERDRMGVDFNAAVETANREGALSSASVVKVLDKAFELTAGDTGGLSIAGRIRHYLRLD